MARTVPEWIGKNDDARPPRSVRARVFRKYGGRCYLSLRQIGAGDEWDLEHIKPLHLAQPGEKLNRETNLAPALKEAHREKTAAEMSAKAKADRIHAKHFGYFAEPKRKLQGRGFQPGRNRVFSARGSAEGVAPQVEREGSSGGNLKPYGEKT